MKAKAAAEGGDAASFAEVAKAAGERWQAPGADPNPDPIPNPNPGESPFGPPDDFGAETLARDVWDAVAAHGSSSL